MGWINIEEYEERLNAREDLLMNEKPRIALVCDNGNEFDYAYNVVKLNV